MKVKFRESFRPFAPAVLAEDVEKYFELKGESPYMLIVDNINSRTKNIEKSILEKTTNISGNYSKLPATTHVDYSARIQTVGEDTSPIFYKLLLEFKQLTGCSVLINTSFNVRGEPIVCNPRDAYECFMSTDIDVLAVGNFLLYKEDQPELRIDVRKFAAD